MFHNLKQIRGYKLAASDGSIGHVKDFYFDDKTWAVRYLVAGTDNWLTDRKVLLSPYAFGRLDPGEKVLSINLTLKQIENSPSIDPDRPVSRQYEIDYYNYFGWPSYWVGGSTWGSSEYPVFMPVERPWEFRTNHYPQWDDLHLRSTNAVIGCDIEATDGPLGSVSSLQADAKSWVIRELTVETGRWYSGKEIRITPAQIERISYSESKVFVKLTKADLERTEEKQLATAGT